MPLTGTQAVIWFFAPGRRFAEGLLAMRFIRVVHQQQGIKENLQ